MTYHWHDDEFDWCLCDEDEEGTPIRVPKGQTLESVMAKRHIPERRTGHDRRRAS